jgi:hypothetical protein
MGWADNITAGDSHRILLLKALGMTKGKVVEFGCGYGSTELLREYCKEHNREFVSYDYEKEWADKFGAIHITDWDDVNEKDMGLLFIDHSPGERRGVDVQKYKGTLMVCHDTESPCYGYDFTGFEIIDRHTAHNTETVIIK